MTVETTDTTPESGSIESASRALDGLLSKAETREKVGAKPEQAKTEPKSEPEQAPPETDEETPSIEAAKPEDKEVEAEPVIQPKTFKVKDNGQEVEVTEDEVLKSYLRVQDYTRKTQALADRQRQFEADVVAKERDRDVQYASHLENLKVAALALMPVEPKWEQRKKEVAPEVWGAEMDQWRQRQEQVKKIEAEQAAVKERQAADAQKGFKAHMEEQANLLLEKLPELADPDKGDTLRKALVDHALSIGYTEEEIGTVADHRAFLLLHEAMQGAKAKAKAPAIQNKIEKAIEKSAPGSKTSGNKIDKAAALRDKARRTGKAEDSAAVLTAMLE